MIIENTSRITAKSPKGGTPIILVQRPINPGLIKNLWIMPLHPKIFEMAKKQERKVEPPGIEPRATAMPLLCHKATPPTSNHPSFLPDGLDSNYCGLDQKNCRPTHQTLSCDSTQILNDHNHTQLISSSDQ